MDRLSKTYIPKRLYDRLRSIYTDRFTLIAAPDGFGKSTTVTEFIKRSRPDGIRIRTISNVETNDECFRAFCRIVLGHEEPMPVSHADQARMIRLFSNARCPRTLVLFDTPAAEKMILGNLYCFKLFMTHSPANTVLLCDDISEYYMRLAEHYDIPRIMRNELTLTTQETAEYYSRCGCECSDPDHIQSATGGEILRVRLCILLSKYNVAPENYLCDRLILSAAKNIFSPNALFAGFAAAAFQHIDETLSHDLLSEPELCSFFGKETLTVSSILNGINEIVSVIPLISYNKKTSEHRAHPIFAKAMYRYFLTMSQEVRAALHRCSAKEFHREGKTFRAFCQYYLAGDYYAAAAVEQGETVSFELLMRSKELLYRFVMECPLDCKPIIPRLIRVLSLLMITPYKSSTRHRFDDIIEHVSRSDDYSTSEKNDILSYTYMLRTYEDVFLIERMGNHIKMAYELYSGKTISNPPFCSWSIYSPSIFSLVHRYSMPIAAEAEQFSRHQNMYAEMLHHGEFVEELYMAEMLYMLGDHKNGLSRSMDTAKKCVSPIHLPSRIIALCTCARCALMLGDHDVFTYATAELSDIMRTQFNTDAGNMAALCLALLSCMKLGTDEEIWAVSSIPDSEVLLNRYTAPFYFFIRCFSLISHGDYRTLITKKDYYIQAAADVRNETAMLMLKLAAAAAHYMENETDAAAELLVEVADTMGDTGTKMPAIEISIHFPALFTFAESELPERYKPFYRSILSEAKTYRRSIEMIRTQELTIFSSSNKTRENAVKLLKKNKELIAGYKKKTGLTEKAVRYAILASQKLSNEEIADICGTSTDSVKSSLKRTFAKLGIRSRGQLKYHFPTDN